jgi:methionyl-tRNA formyltransferase
MSKSAILLGSKPASVAALLLLVDHGWDVTEVVAAPSQARWLPGPSLYDVATNLGIRTVHEQKNLESAEVDLVISYMCRSLVKSETLGRGKYALNFHAGPLPEFGGWAFYNIAILEDSPEYGCTCHIMDEGFDTGPLVDVRRFSIDPASETAVSLERKAQAEMLVMFKDVIVDYQRSGRIEATPQDPSRMRYLSGEDFSKLKQIPFDASPEMVDRVARAFWYPPYEMAYYLLPNGARVEVIPQIVKDEIAGVLHENDLDYLLRLAGLPSYRI